MCSAHGLLGVTGRAEECRAAPQPARQGFPSNSTFHSSFCIRYLLFLLFSHLQEFTALKDVLKQNNHCYNLWPEAHQSTSFHQSAEPVSNREESATETGQPTVFTIIPAIPITWFKWEYLFNSCKMQIMLIKKS